MGGESLKSNGEDCQGIDGIIAAETRAGIILVIKAYGRVHWAGVMLDQTASILHTIVTAQHAI